ncbi:putative RNA-binding protein [Trypanosoma grayi]|uniref:putative RNA-binding protein n=1 Tax=Trypanosoma grayi TaxID=71804 RepID=UPI0004F44A1A|nr:putative RNA-binding protein [Trypanosoma grayi]KEG05826.1 putative RNA-binding protein [Trypanosoma grayi]
MSLTPTLIPHGAPHPLPIPPLQQQQSQQGGAPLFYQTPLEQPLGYPVAAIPAQQGYMSLPSPFVPSSAMMGMPVYFAVPQSSGLPGGVPQQFVVPSNLMASGSYPQQLYSSLVFSP